jgi:hypothetical protein
MAKDNVYTKRVIKDEDASGNGSTNKVGTTLLFNSTNYKLIALGLGLIIIGLFLMSGGAMTDPNVWDEGEIYSFRRITLAPMVILAGLVVEIYAIFKK